jgi:hypothetical protein
LPLPEAIANRHPKRFSSHLHAQYYRALNITGVIKTKNLFLEGGKNEKR